MLKKRGRKIIQSISTKRKSRLGITLIESTVEAGSGSLPACGIESMALRFYPKKSKNLRISVPIPDWKNSCCRVHIRQSFLHRFEDDFTQSGCTSD
jgi:hypothetical protein